MSGYIGNQPVPEATQTRDTFTATSGQTTFSTSGYTPNYLDVYLNGVHLEPTDYTASNGIDVVLASGATAGDSLLVVAWTAFNPASLNASNLDSGTIPDARFPSVLPAIDGSNLTGIQSFTKSASDPAINTNGTLGDMWVNTTSGEVFILTDATSNANVWINVGSGTGNLDFPVASGMTADLDLATEIGPSATTTVTFTNVTDDIDSTFDWAITNISNSSIITATAANGTVTGVSSASFDITTGATTGTSATFDVTVTDSDGYTSKKTWTLTATPQAYDVEYLVIAGSGSGGFIGGGGAGGYRNSYASETSGGGSSTETPLNLAIGTSYTVTIGAGGSSVCCSNSAGNNGSNSVFGSITSTGGGGGSAMEVYGAKSGGSGGGGAAHNYGTSVINGAAGTTNQGYAGGNGDSSANGLQGNGAGGGGAGAVGGNSRGATSGGHGGAGLASSITGSSTSRAGGGGGGYYQYGGSGSIGNGAAGGGNGGGSGTNATSGSANSGSGGGGAGYESNGYGQTSGAGGSGIVILRMPTAKYSGTTTGSPSVSTDGTDTILTFTSSGSYTA